MDIRPVTQEEVPAFYGTFLRAMGFPPLNERQRERSLRHFRSERSLAAFEGGQIVGTTYSHLFELTLPGAVQLPAAGVTAVGVAATHRRRGLLSELMRRQLGEARERGEPLAVLIASESVIYGRFGYGLSSTIIDVEVPTRETAVAAPQPPGRCVFVDEDTADKVFPGLHDRWRRSHPGAIPRGDPWWEEWREEREAGEDHLVLYENEQGEAEGYARYRVKADWDAGLANHTLEMSDLTVLTADARTALWRHCLGADLVRRVKAGGRPVDEPLRWLLTNPRVMKVTRLGDLLWTRILDVPRALSARRYAVPVALTLEVADAMFPELSGRFRLEGSGCERTAGPADLDLSVADLGAILLGGTSVVELAGAGRIRERREGAAREAEAAFRWSPQPWSATWF